MNGHLHPITQFNRLSLKYFQDLGFDIKEGNEIESEWYNFDALNVPTDHPSRDIQDTFWLEGKDEVLRTHTTGSELQIIKENNIKPPFRIIVPGRCYRNERTDIKHEHTFNQIDGIICDKNVNMTHLFGVLDGWIKFTLGNDVKTRIRPSYFPFVEPGLEMDIKLPGGGLARQSIPDGTRMNNSMCNTESVGGWREMLGAGMAHPVVLKNMGIDPDKYQAAMWGPGIDRFTMIKYNIDDIRRFHGQDLRFLKQF